MIQLFEVGGPVGQTQYLFLGDYVDRGSFSVEVLLYLYSLKIQHRDTLFLIRGNHECHHLTEYFTFKEECERKYNLSVYETALQSFNALPLCAVIDRQFLCIHGGISPDFQTIDDIMKIDRFREPPLHGPMCDILWSDPAEDFSPSNGQRFALNSLRGCSYVFTYFAACEFLERNGMLSILRAHEAQDDGYHMCNARASTGFPTVITIFSAPNYLDTYNNSGAIACYNKGEFNIRQFSNSPHPYCLPNFADAFSWSLPFVTQKVKELIIGLLKLADIDDDDDDDDVDDEGIYGNGDASLSFAKYSYGNRIRNNSGININVNRNNTNLIGANGVYRSCSYGSGSSSDCCCSCSSSGSSSMEVSDSSDGTSPVNMGNVCMMAKRARVMSRKKNDNFESDSGDNSSSIGSGGGGSSGYCGCGGCESRRRRAGHGSDVENPVAAAASAAGALLSPPVGIPSAAFSSLPSASLSFSSSVGMSEMPSRLGSVSPVRCHSCGGGGRDKEDDDDEKNSRGLSVDYDCILPLSSSSSSPLPPSAQPPLL